MREQCGLQIHDSLVSGVCNLRYLQCANRCVAELRTIYEREVREVNLEDVLLHPYLIIPIYKVYAIF